LPEIEIEINKLLQLLCNGRVTVEFNTEKASKGKKVSKKPTSIETLEIIVNDQGESRTYETYSGGEQFRVDFACHVGLAKFLAKRAGATIDFFIVDEGLGSQDQTAKDNFVTSVYKLTQSFQQVMCVTHIEEIKEAFNTRVLVTKDPILGSKVQLIEGK
jgi:exonuclease SbcC